MEKISIPPLAKLYFVVRAYVVSPFAHPPRGTSGALSSSSSRGVSPQSSRSHHGKSCIELSGSYCRLPRVLESFANGGAMKVSAPHGPRAIGVCRPNFPRWHDSGEGVCARVYSPSKGGG